MPDLKLSPPWVIYANKVKAVFDGDPDVSVEYDDDEVAVKLYVDNQEKADALARILPVTREFGNVALGIQVIPANDDVSRVELFRRAFEGNPAVVEVASVPNPFGPAENHMVVTPRVVQFPNDDIGTLYRLFTGTLEGVMKDVLEGCHDGIYISSAPL